MSSLDSIFRSIVLLLMCLGTFEVAAKRLSTRIDPRLEIFEENLAEISSQDCQVFSRSIQAESQENPLKQSKAPLVIAINGIPASSWIYRDLALKLYKQGWNWRLVDLPGTARSKMKNKTIWVHQRACIKDYLLAIKEPYVLVLHDIAGPIVLPFINEMPQLKGLLMMNTLLKTKGFKPVPPMSSLKVHVMGDLGVFLMGGSKYRKDMDRVGLAKEVDAIWLDQIYSDLKAQGSKRHLPTILRGFENSESLDASIRKNILDFKGPKIAVWGLSDPSLSSQAALAEELLGKEKFYALTQAKHFLMLDHPTEIAKAFVEAFEALKVKSRRREPKATSLRSTR